MFKKTVILILVLISLITIIQAADYDDKNIKEKFSGWVPEGETFKSDGKVFSIWSAGSDLQRISVSYDDITVLILNDTCEEKNEYFFCYRGAKFLDYDQKLDKKVYQFKIEHKKKVSVPTFTKRTISNENPYLWEETEIVTEFTNDGLVDINEINFSEEFPSTFIVLYSSTCRMTNSEVYWSGPFPQDRIIRCTYRVRPLNITTLKTKATIKYNDNSKQSVSSETLKITVAKPKIEVNSSISKTEGLRLGEDIFLNVIISNTDDASIVTLNKFEIDFFGKFEVKKFSKNLIKDGDDFRFTGKIFPKKNVRINFTVTPLRTGTLDIKETTLYFIDGKRIENEKIEQVEVLVDNITASVKVENGTASQKVKILVMNKGSSDFFKDITVRIESKMPEINREVEIDGIERKNHQEVVNRQISYELEEYTEFPVNITVEYYTQFGEKLSRTYEDVLKVYPLMEEGDSPGGEEQDEAPQDSANITEDTVKKSFLMNYRMPIIIFICAILVLTMVPFILKKIKSRKKFEDLIDKVPDKVGKAEPEEKTEELKEKIEEEEEKEEEKEILEEEPEKETLKPAPIKKDKNEKKPKKKKEQSFRF